MSGIDRGKLKEKIIQSIAKLEEDLIELKEMVKPIAPENAIGRISRMDAINNKSVNEAALRKAEQKLIHLNAALDRIEEEDFGLCVRCKQPIPEGRLLLMPQSRSCVQCAH